MFVKFIFVSFQISVSTFLYKKKKKKHLNSILKTLKKIQKLFFFFWLSFQILVFENIVYEN